MGSRGCKNRSTRHTCVDRVGKLVAAEKLLVETPLQGFQRRKRRLNSASLRSSLFIIRPLQKLTVSGYVLKTIYRGTDEPRQMSQRRDHLNGYSVEVVTSVVSI